MTLVERLCTELLTSKTHQTSIKPSSGAHIYGYREIITVIVKFLNFLYLETFSLLLPVAALKLMPTTF